MPTNDDTLDTMIAVLETKAGKISKDLQKIRNTLTLAESIKKIDVPDPTPEDHRKTKKVLPLDHTLKTAITSSRRDEIYSKIVSDYNTITAE